MKITKMNKKIKIYTSYFAKSKIIPEDIIKISICRFAPKGYKGIQFKKLAPSYNILMEYKEKKDQENYINRFNNEILNKINPQNIYYELINITNGCDCVLLCYEKTGRFCHRNLVSKWLAKNLNITIKEW